MSRIKSILKNAKRRWYLVLPIIVVVGFLVYHFVTSSSSIDKTSPYKVKRTTLTESLSLSGSIDAAEKTTLRFQTSGYLVWVGVKEGDTVKKYQTLASLDQRSVQKNLQKDLNDYMTTRWKFEQTKDDNNKVLTTALQRILDESQFGLNNSVLDVEIQNLAIQYSNLWTPIEGIVTRMEQASAGVNITPAQAEIDVVNPSTVYFLATADQTDVVSLKQNDQGSIALDSYPDKEINGTIKEISFSPKTDETGTVYAVKIYFVPDNSDYRYRMGMTGDVSFVTKEKKNVLAVPTEKIKVEKDKKYVLKATGKTQEKVFPKFGEEIGDYTMVLSGLNEGDIIY